MTTNGNYSRTGGFWTLPAVVQTPGEPLLSLSLAGNQVVISWPSSATGWTLQTNSDLATGGWGNYPGPAGNNRLTNSPRAGTLFFRLEQ